jgi:hypothetical protein
MPADLNENDLVLTIRELSAIGNNPPLQVEAVRQAITLTKKIFRTSLDMAGFESAKVRALVTKFHDAGRRSAPWKPVSGRVPGRPQDGADGNRIRRWLLPPDHKFYATEIDATLVEIRYFMQAMSMKGFPELPSSSLLSTWTWLMDGEPINAGSYLDPIKLIPIEFGEFIQTPRQVTSGHNFPLDRGGKHIPSNTFLTLAISNNLQGNNTVAELLEMMDAILERHIELRHWKRPGRLS